MYNPLQRVNAHVLRDLLKDHPDRALVNFVVNGFEEGFELGLERFPKPRPPCRNLKGAREKPKETLKLVNKDLAKGQMLGPFDSPSFPDMIFSPLNLVDKAGSPGEYRLIHDLSHPYNDQSINACIPQSNSSVKYEYIERVIEIVYRIGSKAWGCCIDFRISLP